MRKVAILTVLLALVATLALPFASTAKADGHGQDIVDIAASDPNFSTLVAAVQAADLVDALKADGPYTVFAPTNESFAAVLDLMGITPEQLLADKALLTEILLYHVVPGEVMASDVVNLSSAPTLQGAEIGIEIREGRVVLDGTANVVATDIMASNGVIHVIDGVLFPPDNILGLADKNGFSIFMTALDEANLTGALLGDGPFTVFVPTNEAFVAALNALGITADQLFADKALLTDILLYHVVSGAVTADQVVTLSSAPTLNGASISISANGGVSLNDGQANVVITDIIASNGVIHVIDGVLLPPQ